MKKILTILFTLLILITQGLIYPNFVLAQICTSTQGSGVCKHYTDCNIPSLSTDSTDCAQDQYVCCIAPTTCSSLNNDPAACTQSPNCTYTGTACEPTSNHTPTTNSTSPTIPKTTFKDQVSDYNSQIGLSNDLTTINGIISTLLPYVLSFSGVILLIMLIMGGFTMLTAVSDPKAAEAGKQQITTAIIGFFILFASYWIIQIMEIILGINILGN